MKQKQFVPNFFIACGRLYLAFESQIRFSESSSV